jgi:hypothetical protein
LAVLSVMLYDGCFAISLGPLFWLVISEINPLRGLAMGISTMSNWGFKLLVALPATGRALLLVEALGRGFGFLDLSGSERRGAGVLAPVCSGEGGGCRSRRSLCTGIAFADCQNCATRQGLRPDMA